MFGSNMYVVPDSLLFHNMMGGHVYGRSTQKHPKTLDFPMKYALMSGWFACATMVTITGPQASLLEAPRDGSLKFEAAIPW